MISAIRRRLARPLRARAKAAQARGDWAAALSAYQQIALISGDRPALALQIGHMQAETGHFDNAGESFKRAAADQEFRLRAMVGLAGLAERRGDWSAAVVAWEGVLEQMALEEATGMAAAWPLSPALVALHLAKCREGAGDGAGAERDFAMALIIDPTSRRSREAVLMRARMLAKTSRASAFRLLKRSRPLYPDDRGIAHMLLNTALDLGRRDDAVAIFRALPTEVRADPAVIAVFHSHGYAVVPETS